MKQINKYVVYLRGFLKKQIRIFANEFHISNDYKMVFFIDNYGNIRAMFNLDRIVGFKEVIK